MTLSLQVARGDFLERDREAAALDLKATSIRNLVNAGEHAVAALGEGFNVQKVDRAAVVRIRQHLQGKSLAPATVAKCLAYLPGAFRRGVDLGIIPANPFSRMKLPKFQTPRPKTFSQIEVDAMIRVCRGAGGTSGGKRSSGSARPPGAGGARSVVAVDR